jgi:hypothetical protein
MAAFFTNMQRLLLSKLNQSVRFNIAAVKVTTANVKL